MEALGHLQKKNTALILSGGGARAAYQVGVLRAISDILPHATHNPFPIICGTSAGAINAVALASRGQNFRDAVLGVEDVWANFTASQVYRTDVLGVLACVARLFLSIVHHGVGIDKPASLLDSSPLRQLLSHVIKFKNIQESIDAGYLHAISVSATGYSSGETISFFQGTPSLHGWKRHRRLGIPSELNVDHLLASSAIPAIFPAVRINREYFGDGAVRQTNPISPALHLGAERVMVIGVSGNLNLSTTRVKVEGFPSIAQILGHVLNAAFIDSFEADIELLQRFNNMIDMIPTETTVDSHKLKKVDVLVISPSQALDQIAAPRIRDLPRSIRTLLYGSGATRRGGASLASYLLFDREFCRELIALGYHDAIVRKDDIRRFFG